MKILIKVIIVVIIIALAMIFLKAIINFLMWLVIIFLFGWGIWSLIKLLKEQDK